MTKDEFTEKIKFSLLGEAEDLVNSFIDYWTEVPINGVKMRFQYEKKFYVKGRWTTWKKNAKNWDKTDISNFPLLQAINNINK